MWLHNLDQCQKVRKRKVLTLGGGRPGELVVTYVCPRHSVTLTGAVSTIPKRSFPLPCFGQGKLCAYDKQWRIVPLCRVRGWFLLSASDPQTKGSPTMTDSQGTVCYATGWEERGLMGACLVDGWSIFFSSIKGIHKVDDFCVRIWHNAGPISSRLATGQLSRNFHWDGEACGRCGVCPVGAQFGRIMSKTRGHRGLNGCFVGRNQCASVSLLKRIVVSPWQPATSIFMIEVCFSIQPQIIKGTSQSTHSVYSGKEKRSHRSGGKVTAAKIQSQLSIFSWKIPWTTMKCAWSKFENLLMD